VGHVSGGKPSAEGGNFASANTDRTKLGRGRGITINTVAPGPVITDSLNQEIPAVRALTEHLVSRTRAEERPGTQDDIADVVLLLASEKSRWVTGQYISVSGGITGN